MAKLDWHKASMRERIARETRPQRPPVVRRHVPPAHAARVEQLLASPTVWTDRERGFLQGAARIKALSERQSAWLADLERRTAAVAASGHLALVIGLLTGPGKLRPKVRDFLESLTRTSELSEPQAKWLADIVADAAGEPRPHRQRKPRRPRQPRHRRPRQDTTPPTGAPR